MNNEQRGRIVFREYTPERELYESRGLTKKEYIIQRFEEETGREFDPNQFEIVEENNAFDDGYDNPISTLYVLRKSKTIEPIPPIPPRGPQGPTNDGQIGPGQGGPENDGPTGPGQEGPGNNGPGNDEPTGPGEKKPGKNPPGGPSGFVPIPPINRGPKPEKKGDNPVPKEPQKPVPTPQVPGYIKKDPEPRKPVPTPQVPEEVKKDPNPPRNNPPKPTPNNPGKQPKPDKTGHPPVPKKPTKEDTPTKPGPTPPGPIPPGYNPPVPIPPGPVPPRPTSPEAHVPTPQLPIPIVNREPEEEKREKDLLVQDMLDKYYGNPQKRREYLERYKRFKSHIIQKAFQYVDQNGLLRTGTCQTIDTTYPEYQADAQFLQLGEYAYRLERLSRSELGDYSLYEKSVNEFIQLRKLSGEQVEESIEEIINLLQREDAEYISTNNFTYNAHRATSENLKTLGKHGEPVSYIPMAQEKTFKATIGNVGRFLANAGILVRKYTTAPISRAIGKFVIRPVHELLFDADQQPAGVYRGQRTHRYVARKVYFESLYLKNLEEENEQRLADGKPLKKINGLVLAFKHRFQAIFEYKEGNIAVLNAGAHDIEVSYEEIKQEKQEKEQQRVLLVTSIDRLLREIDSLKQKVSNGVGSRYSQEERTADLVRIDYLTSRVIEKQKQLDILLRDGKDIIQTDAISLETHDMANKENMTKVVTGVKTAVRIGAIKFIGPRIKKTIVDNIEQDVPETITYKKPDSVEVIPGHWEETVAQVPKTKIKDIKISDITSTESDIVTRSALGGKTTRVKSNFYIRGIAFEGDALSGADANGFSLTTTLQGKKVTLARAQISINPDDSVFDVYAQLNNSIRGTNLTGKDIIDKIANAANPEQELQRMFGRTKIWASNSPTGVPTGWKSVSDIVLDLATEEEIVDEIVKEWIEEQTITIPGEVVTETFVRKVVKENLKEIIDWRYGALEGLLLAGGIGDLNDILRRTRSKEEAIGEKKIDFPQKNQKKPKQSQVLPHQKNNKAKLGKRQYGYKKYNFQGTKKGDYASTYNEAGMGTPGDSVHSKGR